jgi:hypothetical protein
MNTKKLVTALALVFVAGAHAATPVSSGEQLIQQPVEAASAAQPDAAKIEQQTKAMQDMHEKMMAATTPEARAALMPEGMAAMQEGMAMMGQMRRGMPMGNHMGSNNMGGMGMPQDMPMDCTNLDHRMDMMNAMMQLMMDLQPPAKQ